MSFTIDGGAEGKAGGVCPDLANHGLLRQRGADDRQKTSPPVTEKWDGGRENACLAHSYFRTEEAGRGRGFGV